MGWADDFFAGAFALAKQMHERREIIREAQRQARNKRRRDRYKYRPKPEKKEEREIVYDTPTACYCNAVPMPPCGWCEQQTDPL